MSRVTDARIQRWALLAWMLLTAWLIACAFLLQGEYGDGYLTIANARYFFADNTDFYVQRGPLAAIVLWPAQLLVSLFDIDPIDVRPYHVMSAAIHSAYLIACWLLLGLAGVNATARLLAFAAAILTCVFYAYAPYLSHDLVPGLMLLLQIFLCDRWIRRPSIGDGILLVILGASVTLIKQTYAIFWVAILVYALLAHAFKWDSGRVSFRRLLGLAALGAASAILSWISYALFVGGVVPEAPLLLRPFYLMNAILTQYDSDLATSAAPELSTIFSSDLYLRNIYNYGTAAMVLIIPGLLVALRGPKPRQRLIAVCWIICVVAISFIEFREVRYMAFLAPLTAMLIAPVIEKLLSYRAAIAVLTLLVLFDQVRGLTIAAEQLSSAARINVKQFINSAGVEGDIYVSRVLSFVYAADSAFRRDRYHGIYHLTPESLHRLYGQSLPVKKIENPGALGLSGVKPGDRVFYSNDTMVRRPPWQEENRPNGLAAFHLAAGVVKEIELFHQPGGFVRKTDEDEHIILIPEPSTGLQMPVITTGAIRDEDAERLFGNIDGRDTLKVNAIALTALCQADQCTYR